MLCSSEFDRASLALFLAANKKSGSFALTLPIFLEFGT